MIKASFKQEYLTENTARITTSKKCYRDNTLFPNRPELSGSKTDPYHVVLTEIINCGKYEICDFLIIQYSDYLSRADYRLLTRIVGETKQMGYPSPDVQLKLQLSRIIQKLIGDCNYCLWLCATPEDIYDYYLTTYIPKADKLEPGYAASCPDYDKKISLNREAYITKYVSEISLPEEIVPLCDLGREGALIAFNGTV